MEVSDTVANVTLSSTPTLVTRQGRNLGRTRSRGVEAEAEIRLTDRVTLAAGSGSEHRPPRFVRGGLRLRLP